MVTQPPEESHFLEDFRTYLNYLRTHQVRITTLKGHIPLRHLKDLGKLMLGREPFHPLDVNSSFEMRCQRDERRIDFMDMLAMHMELIARSELGYIVPGGGWGPFMQMGAKDGSVALWRAFWDMDWSFLYSWTEIVDRLQTERFKLLGDMRKNPSGQKIFLKTLPPECPGDGFFWVLIRPLEYLGLAQGFFAKDAQGFWFPEAFALNAEFYARPSSFPL